MNIRKKLALSSTILISLMVVISLIAYLSLNKITKNIEIIHSHADQIEKVDHLQLSIEKLVAPLASWSVTGGTDYKAEFEAGFKEIEEKIKEIESTELEKEEKDVLSEVKRSLINLKDYANKIFNIPVTNINEEAARFVETIDHKYVHPVGEKTEEIHTIAHTHFKAAQDKANNLKIMGLLKKNI